MTKTPKELKLEWTRYKQKLFKDEKNHLIGNHLDIDHSPPIMQLEVEYTIEKHED